VLAALNNQHHSFHQQIQALSDIQQQRSVELTTALNTLLLAMPSTIPPNSATDNSFHGSTNLEPTMAIGNIIRGDMSSNYPVSFMPHPHNNNAQDIRHSLGESYSSRGDQVFDVSHASSNSSDANHRPSNKRKLDSEEN
jgi:hypothetical protein